MDKRPIGVFDSGVGGLTVVREMRVQLPHESIVYFGDIARLPYGIKSNAQIKAYSLENGAFLRKQNVKAIVVACNSSASVAVRDLKKKFKVPIIDVINPAARLALLRTKNKKIGLIATQATVSSKAYEKALSRAGGKVKLESVACPLFVPLVEAGWGQKKLAIKIAEEYLVPLKRKKVDTLILGCTHYPLLRNVIRKVMGKSVVLIDSAYPTVSYLAETLENEKISGPKKSKGSLKTYVSDLPQNFKAIGERFLGEPVRNIKIHR